MTAVCITGMHRSGTSLAARAVQLLGADLGAPEQLMGAGPDNPAGYWENRAIKELDDAVLAHLGGAWDQPPVLGPGWALDPALDEFRVRARTTLDETFGPVGRRADLLAWKDPRLSVLLPFWHTVVPVDATIAVVRDPREVAASLQARNGLAAPRAALLWLRYVYAGAAADPGQLRLDQRAFFSDLEAALGAIARHLGLDPPDRATITAVQSHLDPSLRHHVAGPEDHTPSENPIVELADLVWSDGSVALDVVPQPVADALAEGWWRPPSDGEALAEARAKVMKLQDTIRRRELHIAAIRERGG